MDHIAAKAFSLIKNRIMRKKLLRTGSTLGMLAVLIGAMGAHSLEGLLSSEGMETFETGVRYHFYHTFAILICTVLIHFGKKSLLWYAGLAFAIGIGLFSGSLYLLSFRETIALPTQWLGPITPVGGLFFVAGWMLLFASSFQKPEKVKTRKRRNYEEVPV